MRIQERFAMKITKIMLTNPLLSSTMEIVLAKNKDQILNFRVNRPYKNVQYYGLGAPVDSQAGISVLHSLSATRHNLLQNNPIPSMYPQRMFPPMSFQNPLFIGPYPVLASSQGPNLIQQVHCFIPRGPSVYYR